MSNYINERWPESNSNPEVFYILQVEGQERRHYYTVEDLRHAISQARYNNLAIKTALRWYKGNFTEFKPETSAEKSARENRDHCRRIAKELEQYAAGNVYKCPDCGEYITLRDDFDGDKYKCPDCGTVHEIEYLEQQTMWDYLEDYLDIEYRISSDRETVRSVQICVAWGGPSIYLDTETKNVELYWWGDRASYPMSYDVCDALDEWAQELWEIG